jgi:hypothetical protein
MKKAVGRLRPPSDHFFLLIAITRIRAVTGDQPPWSILQKKI